MIGRNFIFLVVAMAFVRAAPAHADDRSEAAAHFKRGRALSIKGDHRGAIAEFELASRLAELPNVVYNLAHEYGGFGLAGSAGEARLAIASYRRYLELRPDAKDRLEVEGFIAELQRTAGAGERAPVIVAPAAPVQPAPLVVNPKLEPPPPSVAPPTVTPPILAPVAEKTLTAPKPIIPAPIALTTAAAAPPSKPRPAYQRWWIWTAIGVVGLAGGSLALGLALTPKDATLPRSDYGSVQVHF